MTDDLHTEAQVDELRAFALLLTPDDDLGLSRGEGALHIALAVLAQEAIEDVYADCGDTEAGVLATNVGQRIAHHLAKALASRPHPSRTEASEDDVADWLGAREEAYNVTDFTDEQTTWIKIAVDDLAEAICAEFRFGPRSSAPRERTEAEVEAVAIALRGAPVDMWRSAPELVRNAYRDQARAALSAADGVTP